MNRCADLIDLLESRRLLSTVTVLGTSGSDEIRMYVQGSTVIVEVNGFPNSYPDFLTTAVSIQASGGSDEIVIDSVGDNRVTVNGGGADDRVIVANQNKRLDEINFAVVMIGGSGNDELFLDDANDDSPTSYTVAGAAVSRILFGGASASETELLRLATGDGNDTLRVDSTSAGLRVVLDGGAGDDLFNVLSSSGDVEVDSGTGLDEVRVNTDLIGPATVVMRGNQDLSRIESQQGGLIKLLDGAGLLLNQNSSDYEGDIDLGRGFMIETNSQGIGGLAYWRDRILNGNANAAGLPKLFSSDAVASTRADGVGFGYAIDLAVSSLGGFDILPGSLLLRYTLAGDTNLDAVVDFPDLVRLAQNYGSPSTNLWTRGDFNLNNDVGFDDLVALAQNYGSSALVSPLKQMPTKSKRDRMTARVL